MPFVQEAVFLHHSGLRCLLPPTSRIDLFGLDGSESETGLPGISERLLEPATPHQSVGTNRDDIIAALMAPIGVMQRHANYGMPLAELEKIQAIITGTPERVIAGLRRYIAAGARHVVVRLGALDLRSQRDQLERLAALIPALRGANACPSPSDASSGPSANLPGTPADPAAHTLSGRGRSPH